MAVGMVASDNANALDCSRPPAPNWGIPEQRGASPAPQLGGLGPGRPNYFRSQKVIGVVARWGPGRGCSALP